MARKKTKKKTSASKTARRVSGKRLTQGLATLALILNVVFPGIGSLIGGKLKTGVLQIILIATVIFFFPYAREIGIVAWIGAIIWGIVTGVQMIKESV